jgi:dCMP deaminase
MTKFYNSCECGNTWFSVEKPSRCINCGRVFKKEEITFICNACGLLITTSLYSKRCPKCGNGVEIFDNSYNKNLISENSCSCLGQVSTHTEQQKTIPSRPSWDEYFINISKEVASRATCDRGRSGCVITKDKQILVTGYVGSPPGMKHCDEIGHLIRKVQYENGEMKKHCVRTIHAEQNAICQAAKHGIPLKDAVLYCKMTPCEVCARLIISCGIKRVVCEKRYQAGENSKKMFSEVGIELIHISEDVERYKLDV